MTLPLVLLLIPKAPAPPSAGHHQDRTGPLSAKERRAFRLFAGVLIIGGAIMSLVSVHLLTLLQARGVALASAVSYGALIGPAQVGARVAEMSFKGRHHPLWTPTAALGLVALGLVLLAGGLPGVGVWLVLYGGGNGIYSIARGTVPLALFGPVRYPLVVGRLARPGLIAQALAPPAGAFVLTYASPDALWWLLLILGLANLGLVGGLWRTR